MNKIPKLPPSLACLLRMMLPASVRVSASLMRAVARLGHVADPLATLALSARAGL